MPDGELVPTTTFLLCGREQGLTLLSNAPKKGKQEMWKLKTAGFGGEEPPARADNFQRQQKTCPSCVPCLWQCQRSVVDSFAVLWPLVLHPGLVEVCMVLVSTWGPSILLGAPGMSGMGEEGDGLLGMNSHTGRISGGITSWCCQVWKLSMHKGGRNMTDGASFSGREEGNLGAGWMLELRLSCTWVCQTPGCAKNEHPQNTKTPRGSLHSCQT